MPRSSLRILYAVMMDWALGATSISHAGEPQGFAYAQIGVRVRDIERSTAFYKEAVGLPLLFRAGNMVFFQMVPTRGIEPRTY